MPKVDKNPVFRAGMTPPVENERAASAPASKPPPLPPKQTKAEKQVYRAEMGPPPEEPESGAPPPKKFAKGGSASARADGIAQRGKTRGTMIMCGGGMTRKK